MKQICLVSDHHLCTNPRTWKEAMTLSTNGYAVSIITVFSSNGLLQRDKELLEGLNGNVSYTAAVDFNNGSLLKKIFYKGVSKMAQYAKKAGLDSVYLLCSVPNTIYKTALKTNADLYICHIDCSLYVGKKLIESGKRVAFDFEDWYSKDYLVPGRPVKLLRSLEKYALDNGKYVTCPSQAMALAIENDYKIIQPVVVYNGFPIELEETSAYEATKQPSLIWFSQTIGQGRGIEKIIQALALVQTAVILHLVGDISDSYRQILEEEFKVCPHHTLVISPQVKHHELHSMLVKHTVGLALEDYYPESRNKTVTNKILQYLQAGLCVLATDTDGQKEIANVVGKTVSLVDGKNISDWADKLNDLIDNNYSVDRRKIIDVYNQHFSWQSQEPVFLKLVEESVK